MPVNHRCTRFILPGLALGTLFGCAPAPPVGVGAALSSRFLDATRLAIAEASAIGGFPALDTLLLSEHSNRAALALELVDSFVVRPGMIAVVGHSNSSASLAAAPVYNGHGVVQIAPTSTAVGYTHAGPFSFRMVPPDVAQGAFLARVIDSLFPSGARVAVMFVNDDYGRGLRAALLDNLDSTRFPMVFQQPHTDEEYITPPADRPARVRSTIGSLLETEPTLLLWLGRATTFHLYLQVLRELAPTLPVIGGDALASWQGQDSGAGEWDGVRFADFLDLDGSAALADFRQRYEARYGVRAGTPEVLSYDAMHLVLAAIRDGARTGDEVRQWLDALGAPGREPYYGISGRIAFDDDGNIARSYVLVPTRAPVAAAIP